MNEIGPFGNTGAFLTIFSGTLSLDVDDASSNSSDYSDICLRFCSSFSLILFSLFFADFYDEF
jgi:hypothetical protein